MLHSGSIQEWSPTRPNRVFAGSSCCCRPPFPQLSPWRLQAEWAPPLLTLTFKLQTSLVIANQESRHHGDWDSALEEIIMERKGATPTDTSSQMWCEEEGDL